MRAAPYAAGFVNWFVAQVGDVGVLLVEFLLTVIFAAAMYANGELATKRLMRLAAVWQGRGRECGPSRRPNDSRRCARRRRYRGRPSCFAGLGLVIAGVPFAGVLTAVMLLLAIAQIGAIPVLGAAVAWLYWNGDSTWGTFLLVWTVVAGTMDNFLRPILIRRGRLPLLLVFAGVVGGLLAFGLIGVFVGPVVLAVADTLLNASIDAEPG